MTLFALFVSSLVVAQWPSLPYNPDENGDGHIGVVDLQGLLANYGNEFASAVISEDGESAITYMGNMDYPPCALLCENLPGVWKVPTLEQLGLVWEEVNVGSPAGTWLLPPSGAGDVGTTVGDGAFTLRIYNSNGNQYGSAKAKESNRCYCAAKQLPRVEYSFCLTTDDTYNDLNATGSGATVFQSCCDDKVENGWYPLGGLSKGATNDGGQAFWRFAQ